MREDVTRETGDGPATSSRRANRAGDAINLHAEVLRDALRRLPLTFLGIALEPGERESLLHERTRSERAHVGAVGEAEKVIEIH